MTLDGLTRMCDPHRAMNRCIIMALTLAGLTAGCANGFGGSAPPAAQPPLPGPASPALGVVAEAPPGAVLRTDDASLGGAVNLDILTDYAAASGRRCKRVAISRPIDGARFSRVACQGPTGWYWTAASIT